LPAVFSHPVIRGLGVVIVDADRSDTSRAFVEQVAASPGLSIVERAGDLASAVRAIRSGEAIGAVYVPADFERDLKAERRPQVVAFYNQQFLTAAGVASSGLSDGLSAATKQVAALAAPKASRIGSLIAETIVLVNPQKNYARGRLCGGLRVSPPQHAGLARQRRRRPDRGADRQARAPVRDLLSDDAVGGPDPGRIARGLVQRRRADDGRSRVAADRRLFGAGRAAPAARARSCDRSGPDRHRGLARLRL